MYRQSWFRCRTFKPPNAPWIKRCPPLSFQVVYFTIILLLYDRLRLDCICQAPRVRCINPLDTCITHGCNPSLQYRPKTTCRLSRGLHAHRRWLGYHLTSCYIILFKCIPNHITNCFINQIKPTSCQTTTIYTIFSFVSRGNEWAFLINSSVLVHR